MARDFDKIIKEHMATMSSKALEIASRSREQVAVELSKAHLVPEYTDKIWVVLLDRTDKVMDAVLPMIKRWRGIYGIEVDMEQDDTSVKSQMRRAAKSKYPWVCFVSDDLVDCGAMEVRRMYG